MTGLDDCPSPLRLDHAGRPVPKGRGMSLDRHPLSPRLDDCPEGLPRDACLAQGWFDREMATVFARQWVCAGRLADMAPGTMRRVTVGAAPVVLGRDEAGGLMAWHNSCPHRGSELCRAEVEPMGKLIRCPYHAWSFAVVDGRLVSTAHAVPTDDFDPAAHCLKPVAVRLWNGFVFVSLAAEPGEIWADVGLNTLDNWPMDGLVTGHPWISDLECNWKAFWENYAECLHCPGIHPELCDLVPVYGTGVIGASEALGWDPAQPQGAMLRPGAESWTMTGAACGPVFAGLSQAEKDAGYTFVTLWPSMYVVAHVDYVRSVRLVPLGPEKTRLIAEWHFAPDTLAQPGFDAAEVAAFATIVMRQDGEASEMNPRGMRSPAFTATRLMPEEYEVHRFHQWILHQMEGQP